MSSEARSFSFVLLGTPVVVVSSIPDVLDRLRVCYATLLEEGEERPGRLRASIERGGASWSIQVDGRPDRREQDLVGAVRALNHELMHALMLRRLDHLYVHAGVVAVDGLGVMLPGLSRAGKSTLVLAMLQRGARFLSDELLVFDPDTQSLRAFARAIKIRDECAAWFPDLAGDFVGEGEGRFLPLTALGPGGVEARATPRLVVAPCWDPAAVNRLEPRTAGEGLLDLAKSALNFGSQKSRSIDHLAALTHESQSFALRWSDPHAAAEQVLAVLEKESA